MKFVEINGVRYIKEEDILKFLDENGIKINIKMKEEDGDNTQEKEE